MGEFFRECQARDSSISSIDVPSTGRVKGKSRVLHDFTRFYSTKGRVKYPSKIRVLELAFLKTNLDSILDSTRNLRDCWHIGWSRPWLDTIPLEISRPYLNRTPKNLGEFVQELFRLKISQDLTWMDAANSAPKPLVRGASWATTQRPVLRTDSKMVSRSHGRIVTTSMTSHETPSFSWASWATSRRTWTWVPQPIRVTSLPVGTRELGVSFHYTQ